MNARIHQGSLYEDRIVASVAMPEDRARHTPVAIKGFFKLAEQWGLTEEESKTLNILLEKRIARTWMKLPNSNPQKYTLSEI